MKKILLSLLVAASAISNAQVYKIGDYNGKTLNICKGQFASSMFTTTQNGIDGVAGYGNNENYTVTFCSGDPARRIRANFYYLNIETAYDFLYIYDGPTTASPLLAQLTGDGNGTVVFPGVYTSSGQCLTFKFVSDAATVWGGWDAFIGCTPVACGANQPASDECISATPICNLGGYCGSTSGWYTRGVESPDIDDNPPTSNKPFCGTVHNNSWLSFTAATANASFDITSSNCSDPSLGIQAVMFETSDCKNFTRVSTTCLDNAKGNFSLSAIGLTVGKKYYIMVDGAFGNDCEYTILAKSGVQTINITASNDNTLCTGQPLVLKANASGIGPFTYKWTPKPASASSDSSTVTYPVATGTTYSCSVTGVCGTPAVVTYLPSVNITPKLTATDSVHICTGGTGANLTATMSTVGSPTIDYTNNATVSIPDNNTTGVTSNIAVGTISGTVGSELEKVCINITHGNVSELDVFLVAPNGDKIDLTSGNGGVNGINYINTCFTVSAITPITSATPPFTGNYIPEQAFSNLSASPINGNWGLLVKDTKANGNGLLTGWTLSFKNDFKYTWAPSAGLDKDSGTTVIANPAVTTTYTATVTDKAGCSDSKPVFVRVTNTPTAPVVSSPIIYCINATATPLTATGSGLLWYTTATGGTGSTTAPTPVTTTAGIFDFYVSQKTSICEGERSKITVVVNNKLDGTFSYPSDSYCQNTANPLPILGNGAINGTFKATPAGLVFVNAQTGEIDLTASKPGTYTIVNEIDPIGGCATVTSDPFTITIHEEPTLVNTVSSDTVCSGVALNIPLSSNVPCTYSWIATNNSNTTGESLTAVKTALINDVITNTTNSPQIVNYTITLTSVAGSCLNIKPQTIDVLVNPAPELNGTPTSVNVCSGVPLNVKLLSTVPSDFSWIAADNINTTGETYLTPKKTDVINDVITNTTLLPQLVKYTVTLTSTANACLNIKPQTIDVTVNPAPELINTPTAVTVCSGTPLDIKLSGTIPSDFSWIATDNTNTTGETYLTAKQSAVIDDVIKNNTAGVEVVKYTITLTSKTGSCGNTKPYTIDVTVNKVTAAFTAKPTTGEVPLDVVFTNASSGKNYKNLWDFGTGATSTDINPGYLYDKIGYYRACLTITDNDNCSDKLCTNIQVYITSSYVIPNVFTPNDDGVNDVFTVKGKGIESIHGEIYNRWGQKEYEWDTVSGGWDGHSASGTPCTEGTYYFILKIKGMDAKSYTEKGSLTLLK